MAELLQCATSRRVWALRRSRRRHRDRVRAGHVLNIQYAGDEDRVRLINRACWAARYFRLCIRPTEPAASVEPSYELGRSVEHLVEHCLGQLAGEGVLLAGVVTTH